MTIDVLGVGLELPYDLTAADDAEKWEQDLARLNQTLREIEERGNLLQSQVIREQIAAMKKWLDGVFGPGSGAKVFDGRENLKTAHIVLKFMMLLHAVYVPKLLNDAWNDAMKRYGPARAQRKA